MLAAAEAAGPSVAAFCEAVMAARPHPEQGFRTCFGVLSPEKTYGRTRLDAACRGGLQIGARSVSSIRSILKTGLDQAFLDLTPVLVQAPFMRLARRPQERARRGAACPSHLPR
jgi:transposase